jgi:hypothetical protein
MTRPPYLRRAAAVFVLVAAVAIEFRPSPTRSLPVAVSDLPAGSSITAADVIMVEVSGGPVTTVSFPAALVRDVRAGDPITATDVDEDPIGVPDGWLAVELEVPESASRGTQVVAVLPLDVLARPVRGVVTEPPGPSDFDTHTALVAFAREDAVAVARGITERSVTVLLGG